MSCCSVVRGFLDLSKFVYFFQKSTSWSLEGVKCDVSAVCDDL